MNGIDDNPFIKDENPYYGNIPVYKFGYGREDYLTKKSKNWYQLMSFDIIRNKDTGKWDVTNDEGGFVTCGNTAEEAMDALEKVLYRTNNNSGGGICY